MNSHSISLVQPFVDRKTIISVTKVLQSKQIVQGKKVEEFEQLLSKTLGSPFAIVVNSGTAALHAALLALEVGHGDEVITTSFSFIATVNAILMTGATPVCVDIDPLTFLIDVKQVKGAITKKTKAILTVDLYGQPCDYRELRNIARQHKLKIISDACQAIGASYFGKPLTKYADIVCLSLYATKNIMTGEGGVVLTNSIRIDKKIRRLRHHGQSPERRYAYFELGYNYRLTDIAAAIGIEQLPHLQAWTQKRNDHASLYTHLLANISGITLPMVKKDRTHVFHQYTIRVTKEAKLDRDELHSFLAERGVPTAVYYPTIMPNQPQVISAIPFKKEKFKLAIQASKEVLSLPIHPFLSKKDIHFIATQIKELL